MSNMRESEKEPHSPEVSSVTDKEAELAVTPASDGSQSSLSDARPSVPLSMKLVSVLLVSCIGFGSQWSSGVTGAMKSTIKKVMFAFTSLEASED